MAIRFTLNDTSYQLPTTWSEVPAVHLVDVVPARLVAAPSLALRVRLFTALTGVDRHLLMRCPSDDVRILVELLDWIWEQELPGGLLTEIAHQDATYLLPQPDLSDVTLAEYALAEHHVRQFALTGQDAELHALLSTICRPERKGLDRNDPLWDGDAREPYNTHLAQRRAPLLATTALGVQQLVLAHFLAGQSIVHERYPKLFEKPTGQGNQQAAAEIEGSPILDLAYTLADKSVFGDFDSTCRQHLYTVLEYLDSKRRLQNGNE